MESLEVRKGSRKQRKVDAVKLHEVDASLRNPPIAVPRPTAATDTPAQIAKADKELLDKIKSGELVVVTAADAEKLKPAAKKAAAASAASVPPPAAAGWVPNA